MLDDLKYASSHEWAKSSGGVATVGISDHAQVCAYSIRYSNKAFCVADTRNLLAELQGELGDVVYVELPEVGSTVSAGETFGVVESVKVRAGPAWHDQAVLQTAGSWDTAVGISCRGSSSGSRIPGMQVPPSQHVHYGSLMCMQVAIVQSAIAMT